MLILLLISFDREPHNFIRPPDVAATRHDANRDASRRGGQPRQSAVTTA
jgi:hypothetical protein